jgi:hypothetical protein
MHLSPKKAGYTKAFAADSPNPSETHEERCARLRFKMNPLVTLVTKYSMCKAKTAIITDK